MLNHTIAILTNVCNSTNPVFQIPRLWVGRVRHASRPLHLCMDGLGRRFTDRILFGGKGARATRPYMGVWMDLGVDLQIGFFLVGR